MDVFVLICGALKRWAQSRAWATILRPKFFNFNMLLYATLFALKLNKDGYLLQLVIGRRTFLLSLLEYVLCYNWMQLDNRQSASSFERKGLYSCLRNASGSRSLGLNCHSSHQCENFKTT